MSLHDRIKQEYKKLWIVPTYSKEIVTSLKVTDPYRLSKLWTTSLSIKGHEKGNRQTLCNIYMMPGILIVWS